MKKNRFILPILVILLIFFLPAAGYGLYNHIIVSREKGNPQHLPKLNNTLYFYNKNDKLLGLYKCETDICDEALTQKEDNINFELGSKLKLGVLPSGYVFINDGNIIKLYNLKSEVSVGSFKLIKNYGYDIENNYLIVKNMEDKYGVLNLAGANISYIISPEYDYMGLKHMLNNSILSINSIIVKKDNNYYLIDLENSQISSTFENEIIDYNDTIIVTKDSDNQLIVNDYEANQLINTSVKNIIIAADKVIVLGNDNTVDIYNNEFSQIIYSKKFNVNVSIKYLDNTLIINDENNNEIEVIDISNLENTDLDNIRETFISDANEYINAALKAFDYQKLYKDTNVTDQSSICYSFNWLKENNYYNKQNDYEGSVLLFYNSQTKTHEYYYWISDKSYYMGEDTYNENITGIKYEANNALILKGNTSSINCGNILEFNKEVIYKN